MYSFHAPAATVSGPSGVLTPSACRRSPQARPENYIECYIAEQNLVSVAIGAGCRNRTIPFVSTFAAFFTRAFDQLRMGAISQTNITCAGSHCGVSIGQWQRREEGGRGDSVSGGEGMGGGLDGVPGCDNTFGSDCTQCCTTD